MALISGMRWLYSFATTSIKTSDWTSAWRFTLNLYSPFDFILVDNSICSGFISILDELNNSLQISYLQYLDQIYL